MTKVGIIIRQTETSQKERRKGVPRHWRHLQPLIKDLPAAIPRSTVLYCTVINFLLNLLLPLFKGTTVN